MKYLNYLLIIVGVVTAMYSNTSDSQHQYGVITGMVLIVIGVYRISKRIPSRRAFDNEDETKNN